MNPFSFTRHRFPPDVIRLGVWLYFNFTLSLRDVKDLLAEWGIELCYKTVQCWANKFDAAIAAAALELLRKLLKNQVAVPNAIVTEGLHSYPATMKRLSCIDRHQPVRFQENNLDKNSHLS